MGLGLCSPLAAADRSIATRSVSPYLPSKYLIMVVSSMAVPFGLSIVPEFNRKGSELFDREDSGGKMVRTTCVGQAGDAICANANCRKCEKFGGAMQCGRGTFD